MKRSAHWCAGVLMALSTQGALANAPVAPNVEAMAEAERLVLENDFARAHALFDREYKSTGSLAAGLKSARALVRLGRLLEASARYEELISKDAAGKTERDTTSARQEAAVDLQQLLSRIPRIHVAVVGAQPGSVRIAFNGARVPSPLPEAGVPVDPGRYWVSGFDGKKTVQSEIEVGEGDVTSVTLRFGPPAIANGPSAPRRGVKLGGQRLTGIVTMGVGVASLLTGTFIGWSALNDEDSLSSRCPEDRCPDRLQSQVDAYEAKKLIALVGVGAGGLLLAGGSILYFSAPSERNAGRVGAYASANGLGVWGKF